MLPSLPFHALASSTTVTAPSSAVTIPWDQTEGSFVSSKAQGELDIVAAAGGGERFGKNTSGC